MSALMLPEAIHPALWTYTLTMHSLWLPRAEALCDKTFM